MSQSNRIPLPLPDGAGLEKISSWFFKLGCDIEVPQGDIPRGEGPREVYVVRGCGPIEFVYVDSGLDEASVRAQNASPGVGVTVVLEMDVYVRLVVQHLGVDAASDLPHSFVLKMPFDYPVEFTAYVN